MTSVLSWRAILLTKLMKQFLLKNRLSPGSVQMTHRIGLTAYRDSNDPVVPRETLIFNHVLTNTGNRYNHYTGVFSADQDGLYVFYFGLECKGAKIQAEIVNDNVAFGFVYCDATSGGYHNSGEMVVREIFSGTSVWVRVVSSSDHNKNTLGDKTIFTGFLLY
ncbi:complement C1q subcomponent subunit A-like isoform X2 [Saccostrea cucullata]|uniref:complement C1q subcomponent subunit A-like isoform X2 n=1 Tax=Saccostrea cuccullata TaxID=36930 RepID=UPI002ED0B08E